MMKKNSKDINDKTNRELTIQEIVELEINLNPDEVKEKKPKVASAPELPVALDCIVVSLRCAVGSSAWLVCCGFLSTGPSFHFSGGSWEPGFGVLTEDIIAFAGSRQQLSNPAMSTTLKLHLPKPRPQPLPSTSSKIAEALVAAFAEHIIEDVPSTSTTKEEAPSPVVEVLSLHPRPLRQARRSVIIRMYLVLGVM